MRLLILGATGKTGAKTVEMALARNHTVTAFVRDRAKMTTSAPKLHVIEGDMLNPESIERAFVERYDAVISALGIFHREPKTDLSDGTRNVLEAMQRQDIQRIAVVSSIGAGDSRGQGNFFARNLQRLLLSHVIDDKDRQEAHIEASGLDWTIVRPPQLTDNDTVRTDLVTWQGPSPEQPKLTWKTSRASVAGFLLDAVEQGLYIKQAINISEPK
jgi:uncharacterized protein YbjT (DUF2867 family)